MKTDAVRPRLRMVLSVLSVTLLVAIGLSGCVPIPPQYSVSGRVVSEETGLGVKGVTISFSGGLSSVVTASDGKWIKTGLKGTVVVTANTSGWSLAPSSRVVTKTAFNVDFVATPAQVGSVFWYSSEDDENFTGGCLPASPTDAITSLFDVTYYDGAPLTTAPQGYDALVISDTGASFDISDFEGSVIVTFDSGIAPLFYWLTGDMHDEDYWDYDTEDYVDWVEPDIGTELGTWGDARVYDTLAALPGFTRRADLLQARSTSDADDIVIYQIELDEGSWWWVHVGPHMGDYADAATDHRVSEIIAYALGVINGDSPVLTAPPAPTAAAARSVKGRN